MSIPQKTLTARRPASDLIDAVVENMRANLEVLRYSIVAPSRYTVYLSASEFQRLEGLIPRLRAEAIRALDEELARLNRRSRPRRAFERLVGRARTLEGAEAGWHVEFLPDLDDELEDEQDILVQSDLVLPAAPELGAGERTRRVTTVRAATVRPARQTLTAAATVPVDPSGPVPAPFARLTYEGGRGQNRYEVVRESTTIGRGGLRFPVDVKVAASDEVSREHARIRRDPSSGAFFLIDLSTHGTTVNGERVPRGFDDSDGAKRENGTETPLPDGARIGLAGVVLLDFERAL
jgi:hypothetical protein